MKSSKIYFLTLIMPLVLIASSCSSNSANADEPEVETMDSISKGLDQSAEALEDQAKKVEASLEKVDKEFETAQ